MLLTTRFFDVTKLTILTPLSFWSRYSAFSVTTRLRHGSPRNRGFIPSRSEENTQRFSGIKWPEYEITHSFSTAEVRYDSLYRGTAANAFMVCTGTTLFYFTNCSE